MKYKIINSDLFLKGKLIPENSEVDLSEEETKGIENFLEQCHSDPDLSGEESPTVIPSKVEGSQSKEKETKSKRGNK